MGRPKKGHFCFGCKKEYSERYYRRHECGQKNTQESSSSDDEIQPRKKHQQQQEYNHENSNNTSSTTDEEYYMSKKEVEHHLQRVLRQRENNYSGSSENTQSQTSSNSDSEYDDGSDTNLEDTVNSINDRPLPSFIRWILIFMLMFQRKYFISDNALLAMLVFLRAIVNVLAGQKVSGRVPCTIYSLRKSLGLDKDEFIKYVSCTLCHTLYNYDDCIITVEGITQSKRCSFIKFPNHRLAHYRTKCNTLLLKEVKTKVNRKLLPIKVYCYYPFEKSFSQLLQRANIHELCQQWRSQNAESGVMSDVFDGKVWKEFADPNKHNFLSQPNNYACMLNLDWFQPYTHVTYSVGVMYMVILNLPRRERFKRENVMIIGILPNCNPEPKTNTFIQPLVDELLVAWNQGFPVKLKCGTTVSCKIALLCVGCDIPACRKLCGFLGHSAKKGCSRCAIEFPGTFCSRNYGGFDRTTWPERTYNEHMQQVEEIKNATSQEDRKTLESLYGTRYSVLLQLPYFNPIRMSIVDPMHNLFLGTSKNMLRVWKDKSILNSNDFKAIQAKVDAVTSPADIGRIPHKIESGFAGFTADQLKNWVLIYSMYCLKGVLPEEHLKCWQSFVLACKIMCSKVITHANITTADECLMQFCVKSEALYGSQFVTPNMHLHGHLRECILDYGPVYAFWLFSFERENGILGSYTVNRRDIEIQLMRRFNRELSISDIDIPDKYSEQFLPVIRAISESGDRGSLKENDCAMNYSLIIMASRVFNMQNCDWSLSELDIKMFKQTKASMSEFDLSNLKKMYQYLYGTSLAFEVCSTFFKGKEVYSAGTVWGSASGRSKSSSYVSAFWPSNQATVDFLNIRAGQVEYFMKHIIIVKHAPQIHIIAKVKWFKECEDRVKNHFGKPVEVWKINCEPEGPMSYIPVQRLKSKCIMTIDKVMSKRSIVIIPRDKFHI